MSDFPRSTLELALSWHLAQEVLLADLEIAETEHAWLAQHFPQSKLQDAGLADEAGARTPFFHDCVSEALITLPETMSRDDKLTLIKTLFAATLADNDFHHKEGNVLVRAVHMLGLSDGDLDGLLGSLDQVGDVDLPDPE
jgi:uncharacterized tellurite resistance protein B-like protein